MYANPNLWMMKLWERQEEIIDKHLNTKKKTFDGPTRLKGWRILIKPNTDEDLRNEIGKKCLNDDEEKTSNSIFNFFLFN